MRCYRDHTAPRSKTTNSWRGGGGDVDIYPSRDSYFCVCAAFSGHATGTRGRSFSAYKLNRAAWSSLVVVDVERFNVFLYHYCIFPFKKYLNICIFQVRSRKEPTTTFKGI